MGRHTDEMSRPRAVSKPIDRKNSAENQVQSQKTGDELNLDTPERYAVWERQHADALRRASDKRQRAIREADEARFAKAQDIIIGIVKRGRRDGLSLEEAMRTVPIGPWGQACDGYTYTDLVKVAKVLCPDGNWLRAKRQEGGAA